MLKGLFNTKSIEDGISVRHDLSHRFTISRGHDAEGFQYYVLENTSKRERLVIRRFLFDQFRAAIRDILISGSSPELRVSYKGLDHFVFAPLSDSQYVITQLVSYKHSTGVLHVSWASLKSLDKLLFDRRLEHPNDLLNLIVDYHKLFQFTFEEATESITSDLAIKRGVLSHTEAYVPSLNRGQPIADYQSNSAKGNFNDRDGNDLDGLHVEDGEKGKFRSRLAERSVEKDYAIHYEDLFARKDTSDVLSASDRTKGASRKTTSDGSPMLLPLHASEVKTLAAVPFKCELTPEEMESLRVRLSKSKNNQLLLGFEMIDAVYRSYGKLRTFRFPLYYLRVQITESGRFVYLHPLDDHALYLNHLALATLFQQFGRSAGAGEPVGFMFESILKQQIKLGSDFGRVCLKRLLPVDEEVFTRVREVLLGFPGENGKNGILANLKTIGLESDLESVYLYESPKLTVPTSAALEEDLAQILMTAKETPERFYSSLLGRFLSPGMSRQALTQAHEFYRRPYFPGAVPKSTKRLLGKLNDHDLVLLEGPPGTGKTHTIMNLLLHCLCTNKRLLVVSDKQGAVHALTEKIENYLLGKDRHSSVAKRLDHLWRSAIKVVDEVPKVGSKLDAWCMSIRRMLAVDLGELDPVGEDSIDPDKEILRLDSQMEDVRKQIQKILTEHHDGRNGGESHVSPKHMHATTLNDILGVVEFLRFNGFGNDQVSATRRVKASEPLRLTQRFIEGRRKLASGDGKEIYDVFEISEGKGEDQLAFLSGLENYLRTLRSSRPMSVKSFEKVSKRYAKHPLVRFLHQKWREKFPDFETGFRRSWRCFRSFFFHPVQPLVKELLEMTTVQKLLVQSASQMNASIWYEYQLIDRYFRPGDRVDLPLSLEILNLAKRHRSARSSETVQSNLEKLAKLQVLRDHSVKELVLKRLREIHESVYSIPAKSSTNSLTTITTLLDSLGRFNTLEEGWHVLREIQEKLFSTFPIWICRKQDVSFLFPCRELAFDLVIVDEATQCRVDDALPLLFRARKLMVVGDEKQTVLDKNSVIDDYLFNEFSLEEHLRSTQARGIKGGGSNIFSLIKSIRQGSVMLDEHYRCPPDIIEYSNKYVYGSELKTMQWSRQASPPAVYIDFSEAKVNANGPRASGKYKGIETDMFDRFLDFVERSIKQIERETGERINVETDVGICYFLLKNEPYAKDVKGDFLMRLNRGGDILDGAGAALQGKERDYIFYYWDVNRGNMAAFRQGDEEDKRKGELNVLMSRPKRRAYHFLSKGFAKIDHRRASITDYLWSKLQRQDSRERANSSGQVRRLSRPGIDFYPWQRTSGPLISAVINYILEKSGQEKLSTNALQFGVIVGDPSRRVDLMILTRDAKKPDQSSVAIVDLAGFNFSPQSADEIIDFYFQLRRAQPKVQPVFTFMHELIDPSSETFQLLNRRISKARGRKFAVEAA